jgi:radical SAM protein with 4Fe4S-binding SPASM domain
MITVNTKGQVVLCCSDLYSDVVMGDIATETLEQIWTNQSFAHYRTHLSLRGRHGLPLCGSCSFQGKASAVYYPLPAQPKRSQ